MSGATYLALAGQDRRRNTTMAGLLSEEDLVGEELIKVYEFKNEEELNHYITNRGWQDK